ncbi:MAG: hypothetical protein A49_26250 [Methyloceanibacter sp.]|nr:MAG: hypothetical protein A49_26250 [Methyloceanibacter sp.]
MVPLGYMWAVLAVSKVAGLSECALRLVAFAGGIAALLLFWRFAARHFGRRVTLLAVAFLAAAYYPIRHGAEVKPYSTDLLIAVSLLMAGWAVYSKPQRPIRWIGLILLASAAVWCSYPSVFVSGAVGMLLTLGLWSGRWRTARNEPAPSPDAGHRLPAGRGSGDRMARGGWPCPDDRSLRPRFRRDAAARRVRGGGARRPRCLTHRPISVRSREMSDLELITFGCRLNAYGDRSHARARRCRRS